MLRQVRHISEGNFYGLRVTNKARKLTLAKEIRTLEACRDVQTHVYRKEEKELLGTLKRLQLTKHDHFDHHEDYEHPERLASHHDRGPSFHAKQHSASDDQQPLRRPAEPQHRKIHLKIKSEIGDDHRSSTKVNVSTNVSDVSVIISHSPIADSNTAAKQMSLSTLPPVSKREAGTDLHRTEAFTYCVVCNLPPYAHGRESKCTCQANPSKKAHHSHDLKNGSKKRMKSNTDEEDLQKFGAQRERRRSWEDDNVPARLALKQRLPKFVGNQIHHGRSRTSSFEDDNKNSHAPRGLDDYTSYVPGIGPHKRNLTDNNIVPTGHGYDHRKRSRENSLGESKSRKSNLDEGPSRWRSYTEDRSRESRFEDQGEPHYMRPPKGHGSRPNKTRQEEELYDLYNRLQRIFPVHDKRQYHSNEGDPYHRYNRYPGDHPHSTHLPLSKSHRDATSAEKAEDQAPAFSGLLHPDNIINHHHFLPHEANKQEKSRSTSLHAPVHPAGFHVFGVDHHGHRQEVS